MNQNKKETYKTNKGQMILAWNMWKHATGLNMFWMFQPSPCASGQCGITKTQ